MVRESAIGCFTVYGIGYIRLTCLSFVITKSVCQRKEVWGDTEVGIMIHGRTRAC